MKIDRNSPLPLYYQLKNYLIGRIESGEWKPGDLLPTELNLQEKHALSRTTVRQAIRELELEGKVTRYRGRGTFVAEAKIAHSPEPHKGISDFLKKQGKKPGWRVISSDWISPPKNVISRLKIKNGTKVFCLKRLRLADNQTIGFHTAYVSPEFREGIDEKNYTKRGSLDYLSKNGSLEKSKAYRIIEAVPAGDEEASFLEVDLAFPLLLVKRLVVSASDIPIEYFKGYYRGDRPLLC